MNRMAPGANPNAATKITEIIRKIGDNIENITAGIIITIIILIDMPIIMLHFINGLFILCKNVSDN